MNDREDGRYSPNNSNPEGRFGARNMLRIIGISIAGVLALIGVGFVVLLVWAWRGVDASEQAKIQGQVFGQEATDTQCLDAAIARFKARDGWIVHQEIEFMRGCLSSAQASVHYCDQVPLPSEEESWLQWSANRCASLEMEETDCRMILWPLLQHCTERRARSVE
jgi:hypothetical protein